VDAGGGILGIQAPADADYFVRVCGRTLDDTERDGIEKTLLAAYRWQYIASGVQDARFQKILDGLTTEAQRQRIGAALAPILS
jgi:hypothetical protein